jgi:hypothetical protein
MKERTRWDFIYRRLKKLGYGEDDVNQMCLYGYKDIMSEDEIFAEFEQMVREGKRNQYALNE